MLGQHFLEFISRKLEEEKRGPQKNAKNSRTKKSKTTSTHANPPHISSHILLYKFELKSFFAIFYKFWLNICEIINEISSWKRNKKEEGWTIHRQPWKSTVYILTPEVRIQINCFWHGVLFFPLFLKSLRDHEIWNSFNVENNIVRQWRRK